MANVRFAVAIQRMLPFLGYHHIMMMILSFAVVMAALLLAGCTSSTSAMSNIYILSISYQGDDNMAVRANYFSVCARGSASSGTWVCSSNAAGLRAVLAGVDGHSDPMNTIEMAAHFRGGVIFSGLLLAAVALSALTFCLLATFPGWHEEHDARTGSDIDIKPFPSRPVSLVAAWAVGIASLFSLVSALWQHIAASAAAFVIDATTRGSLAVSVGPVAMALGWLVFALIMAVTLMLIVMIYSIHQLDMLTDD